MERDCRETIARVLEHREPEYAYGLRAHADYIEQLKNDCLYLARSLRHSMEINRSNADHCKKERAKLEEQVATLKEQVCGKGSQFEDGTVIHPVHSMADARAVAKTINTIPTVDGTK